MDVCRPLPPGQDRLPLLEVHSKFVAYIKDSSFQEGFGFTIFGKKVVRYHLVTFTYTMVSLLVFIFIEAGYIDTYEDREH